VISLPPRLRAVAELIPAGARVVDVGTDHARLPVYLMQRGLVSSVLATDLHAGPLRRARRLLVRCGLDGVVPLRQADGLSGLPLDQFDVVVMAGLGADTILELCRQTPPPAHVICLFQPMSHAERLRAWWGDAITAERLVREENRLYSVMTVSPGDKLPEAVPPGRRYVGRALEQSGDPLLNAYLDQQIARLAAEAEGLSASRRPEDDIRRAETGEALTFLREM